LDHATDGAIREVPVDDLAVGHPQHFAYERFGPSTSTSELTISASFILATNPDEVADAHKVLGVWLFYPMVSRCT
jgi:hypothetical protein